MCGICITWKQFTEREGERAGLWVYYVLLCIKVCGVCVGGGGGRERQRDRQRERE